MPDKKVIITAIVEIIRDALSEDMDREINENTDIFVDLGLDSVSVMSLVMGLQEHFDIEFSDDDIDIDNFQSPLNIFHLLSNRLQKVE